MEPIRLTTYCFISILWWAIWECRKKDWSFFSLSFFIIIYLLVFYFYLIKTKIFRKSHIIYILIISVILECGIFFLMAFQDFLNQLPNNIPNWNSRFKYNLRPCEPACAHPSCSVQSRSYFLPLLRRTLGRTE